jgi:hypothetical protein
MAIKTRSDAGDNHAATSEPAPSHEAGLRTAKLPDIRAINASHGSPTYVHDDEFNIIMAAGDSTDRSTAGQRLQEFVDGFGHLGKLYGDSISDQERFAKFQERMQGVYTFDRQTFKAMGRIGDSLISNPPAAPEQVGKKLADILSETMKRQGGNIDLSQPDWLNLQAAMAGVMIGAGSTFRPGTKDQQNIAMVDSMDAQLRKNRVPYVNAIVWGDTKEPGLAIIPPNQRLTTQQRHNYM